MTESEKQQIVGLVLQSLKTNSLTIEQLTELSDIEKDMFLEVSGGCKISLETFAIKVANVVDGSFDEISATIADLVDRFNAFPFDDIMNEVFPLSFRSFNGGGTFEKGQVVTPGISWTLERKNEELQPSSATVNGSSEGISDDLRSYTGVPITSDASYRVLARCGVQSVERTAVYSFRFMKYWGVSDKTILNSADVLAMNHSFATSKTMGKTTFNCTGGKYPYYILPEELLTNIEVWINGFRNTDIDISDLEVTNDYNVSKNYKVVRLNTIQTGILTIEYK